MPHKKKELRLGISAFALSLLSATSAVHAQADWPSKPLRLVVGAPAGGSADTLARLLAEGLQQELRKPVIVEAKPGAGGVLAVNDLKSNGKDGHTFLVIQGGIVAETPLAYKVNYQPFTDLKPLAQLSRSGLVLVANKDLPVSNLQQLIEYTKTQKGGLDFASYATGMKGHTSGILLAQQAKIELKHVGYKGSPPGLTDLMGGHVPLMFDGLTTSLPLIKSGKIKPIAVNYPTRIAELSNTPTFKELGYPQLAQSGWFAVWARPDAPAAVQQKVRDITLAYFSKPEVQKRVIEMGMDAPLKLTTEELTEDLKQASQLQAAVLKSINYKAE